MSINCSQEWGTKGKSKNTNAPILDLNSESENDLPPLMDREDDDSDDESYDTEDDVSEGDDKNLEAKSWLSSFYNSTKLLNFDELNGKMEVSAV